MNIYDLISRAQKLREETKIDSVSPDRVGALCEDTLKYINEYQLLASSPALHKIYVSVSAMQSDRSPKSDITGNALKPGQLVVIVPASQSDATAGNVYRYDGPSGNTSAWTFVSKIGAVPADAELNASSANPVQNMVVTAELTGINKDLQGVHQQLDGVEEGTDRCARDIESLRSRTTRLEIEMPNKANQSGKYPEMTAGFANNLVGRGEAVEATINFRASGGKSIEDGAARVKELKGNSVVWNQMSTPRSNQSVYGLTFAPKGSAVIVKGTLDTALEWDQVAITQAMQFKRDGRKYLIDLVGRGLKPFGIMGYGTENNKGFIFSANADGEWVGAIGIHITLGESIDMEANVLVVDLTQMFGQGNEPTSVEEFYSRIPQNVDLYAYNEGEILSTDADGIKSVGFNAWDEQWEQGYYETGRVGTTLLPVSSSNRIRCKNAIKVLPNTQYCLMSDMDYLVLIFCDNDGIVLNEYAYGNGAVFTTPANCGYLHFFTYAQAPNASYSGKICINLSHSGYRNGEYQPYVEFIRNLDTRIKEAFPNGLRSAGNAHDKVYNKNGKGYIEKRIGVVDMGSLEWYAESGRFNSSAIADIGGEIAYRYLNVLCRYTETMSGADKTFFVYENKQVYLYDSAYTNAASLKAALKGVPLYYELAEPEVIEYDEPFNLDYEVWDFGTEQMLASRPSAPIKASIVYGFNAVDSVRTAQLEIAELKTQIAQMQASMASMITQNVNVTTE